MVEDPHEIILDHLRAIRAKQDEHSKVMTEQKEGLMQVRESMQRQSEDITSLRGDILRLERGLASVEHDVDRIKARLDLHD